MGKMPYIPLYIGDWEQDTNTISLEAEGALIKLTFKLWKAKPKGLLVFCFSQIAILFKKNEVDALKILRELQSNNILNIMIDESKGEAKIESRRMMHETAISEIRSNAGRKGGLKTQKQTSSKRKTKVKQKREYEYEYENEIDNDIDINITNEHDLIKKIRENYPTISKLKKQLTVEEAEKICSSFPADVINSVLDNMENYKPLLQKYVSVSGTLTNWCKMRNQSTVANKKSSKGKINDRYSEVEEQLRKDAQATI